MDSLLSLIESFAWGLDEEDINIDDNQMFIERSKGNYTVSFYVYYEVNLDIDKPATDQEPREVRGEFCINSLFWLDLNGERNLAMENILSNLLIGTKTYI